MIFLVSAVFHSGKAENLENSLCSHANIKKTAARGRISVYAAVSMFFLEVEKRLLDDEFLVQDISISLVRGWLIVQNRTVCEIDSVDIAE